MLTAEQYRSKLASVLEEIRSLFDLAEIRGSDDGSFIYAVKEKRAVEIYQSDHNVIVEFWENEELRQEKDATSFEKAAQLVTEWMQKKV